MPFFIFAIFIFFGHFAGAQSFSKDLQQVLKAVNDQKLFQDRQWLKLLHVETDFFGITESQIDSSSFFLSAQGKKNPQAELNATVIAFFNDEKYQDSFNKAQCRFPARYKWLKNKLTATNIQWPDSSCERFEAFAKGLSGNSVALVFSSYYLNNPSSAFGHTFLRINKLASVKDGKRHELLDYGLNYAAETDTNNAFLYGFKGLFGLFPGKYKAIPYYMKVREYNNAESRDLWEYELNLGPEAVSILIAHVWELGPTEIDYWYLTENCSYHMLSLLEAADPHVDVLSSLSRYVIPSDTIRVLWNQNGLVKKYKYRPSGRETFSYRFAGLSEFQRQEVQNLAEQIKFEKDFTFTKSFNEMPSQQKADTIDTAIDFIDYRYSMQMQESGHELNRKLKLLEVRSQIPDEPVRIQMNPSEEKRPHLSHGSRRWGIGIKKSSRNINTSLLSYRFALHDRLDPLLGYPSYSQLSFFDFDFSISKPSVGQSGTDFQLENLSVFELVSASPWSRLQPDHSWRFKIGIERTQNKNFPSTQEAVLRLGGGWTLLSGASDISAHLLAETHFSGAYSENKLWLGVGPHLELHHEWNTYLLSQVSLQYRYDSVGEYGEFVNLSFDTQWSFNKSWGLRASYHNLQFTEDVSLQLFNYY